MKLSVFGLGYVGAVSCGCFPDLGHEVIGVDIAQEKVDRINRGESPIVEVDLPPRITKAVESGKLRATMNTAEAVRDSDMALLCVGTPSTPTGGLDGTHLKQVCQEIGTALREAGRKHFPVVVRSTCLPPLHAVLRATLAEATQSTEGDAFHFVVHPEFLREGAAVDDFFHPPKIVFGLVEERVEKLCRELYPGIEAPLLITTPQVASMVKYADNCFHATKVTFANEIGLMCHQFGVDSQAVMDLFCRDLKLNISPRYLRPGAAFGGSCLPKDLRALLDAARAEATPLPMMNAVIDSNRVQVELLMRRILSPERPPVGMIGLTFKEGTDDVREAPMVSVVEQLTGKGYRVQVYDHHLAVNALVGRNRSFALNAIPHLAEMIVPDLQKVVNESEVVVISHRLKPEAWRAVEWRAGQRIIDLVNIPELRNVPGYEGLYW